MTATWDISSVEFDRKSGRMFYGIRMSPDMIGARAYKLIAAAPDLLEALKGLPTRNPPEVDSSNRVVLRLEEKHWNALLSAIAKAEGR